MVDGCGIAVGIGIATGAGGEGVAADGAVGAGTQVKPSLGSERNGKITLNGEEMVTPSSPPEEEDDGGDDIATVVEPVSVAIAGAPAIEFPFLTGCPLNLPKRLIAVVGPAGLNAAAAPRPAHASRNLIVCRSVAHTSAASARSSPGIEPRHSAMGRP